MFIFTYRSQFVSTWLCVTDVKTIKVKKEAGGQESSSNNSEKEEEEEEEEEKYDPNLDLEMDFPQGKH